MDLNTVLVLILLDRSLDLVPMLSHSWTYQALIHDVLDLKLNRIIVEVGYLHHPSTYSFSLGNTVFMELIAIV